MSTCGLPREARIAVEGGEKQKSNVDLATIVTSPPVESSYRNWKSPIAWFLVRIGAILEGPDQNLLLR